MTESEWLNCADPPVMLAWLQGRVSERKARLYGCACCRRRMRPDLDPRGWQAVEAAERYAEGRTATWRAPPYFHHSDPFGDHTATDATLLRDIVGNPFRFVCLDPAWLTPTVTSLAQAAYDERALPSGEVEPARLAILGDALEEAGCSDADILDHCRQPGEHVRGCWVVDLILGKE